ncbi:MAG: hypothetical protein H2212_15595 [Ruminococcus sp.]|nr:hypothetical protein [Ruminococcus sp.]
MDNKKKQISIVNIGSSSLLVVFLVLCLVTFSTLSLSSAKSNYNFSQRLADRRADYYEASRKAELLLDSIDNVLAEIYEASTLPYYSEAEKRLSELTLNEDVKDIVLETNFSAKTPSVSYAISINKNQALSVVLELTPVDNTAEGFYQIKQWKAVSTADWEGNNTLKLIQ